MKICWEAPEPESRSSSQAKQLWPSSAEISRSQPRVRIAPKALPVTPSVADLAIWYTLVVNRSNRRRGSSIRVLKLSRKLWYPGARNRNRYSSGSKISGIYREGGRVWKNLLSVEISLLRWLRCDLCPAPCRTMVQGECAAIIGVPSQIMTRFALWNIILIRSTSSVLSRMSSWV